MPPRHVSLDCRSLSTAHRNWSTYAHPHNRTWRSGMRLTTTLIPVYYCMHIWLIYRPVLEGGFRVWEKPEGRAGYTQAYMNMGDHSEVSSAPITPRPMTPRLGTPPISAPITPRPMTPRLMTPPISAPPSQFHSPSLSRSPLLSIGDHVGDHVEPAGKTPRTSRTPNFRTPIIRTPRFITPLGSPIRKALRLTKLDPQDAWLPITESRNGNAYYAAFHTLSSGIGIQALVLPVAFTVLGWTWGTICMVAAFIWQLYTLYLLVNLHESTETGMRYSRYLQLFNATFGEKMGSIFAIFPIMYLSGATCVALIIMGGSTMKQFYLTICGGAACSPNPPTVAEWYLIFTCAAVVLSQLPNLNSIAGVSLIGAITAVGYCTMVWIVSVAEGQLDGVSYNSVWSSSEIGRVFDVLNALGIFAFAFRGHNLILEIQATMPSDEKHPSHVPMWKGVKFSYTLIAMCLFPLAIGGYWAYGQKIPGDGGILQALFQFHGRDTSQVILGLTSLFVIINAVCSFQIYGMPTYDDIESKYTMRMKKPCPKWLRALIRALFGFGCFLMAVAIPFLSKLAGLIGGFALPVTFAYPCFLWLKIKKPKMYGPSWFINWGLGTLGMALSVTVIAASLYILIDTGLHVSFFNPK